MIASGGALTAGQWTHVAAIYDGVEMLLYKDGVLVGRMPKQGIISASPTVSAAIGNQPLGVPGGSRPFDGLIDSVRVYDRALSATEISLLDMSHTTPTGPNSCCRRLASPWR